MNKQALEGLMLIPPEGFISLAERGSVVAKRILELLDTGVSKEKAV